MKRQARLSATPFTSELSARINPHRRLFPAAHDHKHDSTGDRQAAEDRRQWDGVFFGMTDLHRADIDVLLMLF
jgi:hypothetical protein